MSFSPFKAAEASCRTLDGITDKYTQGKVKFTWLRSWTGEKCIILVFIASCYFNKESMRWLNNSSSDLKFKRFDVFAVIRHVYGKSICHLYHLKCQPKWSPFCSGDELTIFSPQHLPRMRPKTFSGNKRLIPGVEVPRPALSCWVTQRQSVLEYGSKSIPSL